MSGNSVSLNAGITAANALINLSSLKLNNSLTFTAPTAAISATIQSTIDTNGKTLTVAGPGNYIFLGIIGGSGGLTKTGSGLTKLAGGNVYTGQTEVDDGTLLVLGSQSSSSVIVKDGGTLGGDGAVGPVQIVPLVQGGTISPGDINHDSGILTAGSVSFPAAKISNFNVDLNGTTVGSGYDQLNVFGTVSLGSSGAAALCSLNLTLGFTPTPGATFIIVKNVGTDSISGEFAGKPEGSSFAVNGTTFFITYKGGDGNDVALRVADTWDGGGTTNNWTEAANWLGDVAPTAGAILIFPDSAARKANTNDFPHDTNFSSITVTGKGYQINGNSITLSNGITVNTPIGLGPTFGPSITLTQPQTFTNIGTQTFRLDGQLNLNGFGVTIDGSNNYNFNGKVTGAGGIIKNGSGTLFIEGQFNNYTGVTQLNGGTLQLHSFSGLGATGAGNDTVINSGSMFLNTVTTAEAISLNGGELGAIACNAGCAVTGGVTLTADSTIQVTSFSILTVNSVIQTGGTHTLTKTGPGTLILTETSTHSATNITAGTLLVNGVCSGVTDINGGTLGGTGTVGAVSANSGSISPGASPGTGTLSTGNVTFSGSSSFVVEIGGTAAKTQYDRVIANGSVALNGANLSASLINGFVPGAGDHFTIIQSTGSISGTFAQGNSITIGGKTFSIIYNPNDVMLTVPTTRMWSGGGTTNNWSEGANWVGGVAPGPGDDLVFPPGAARKRTSTNDFASGTTFNSILLTDGGYTLLGNGIRLTHGIVDSSGNSTQDVSFSSITLGSDQTFSEPGPASLIIVSPLDTNGRTLTLDGPGSKAFLGIISGSGTLIINGAGGVATDYDVTSTLSGPTIINSGTYYLGRLPNSAIQLNDGNLYLGNNCSGKSLAATSGLIYQFDDLATTINGNLTLNSNVTYRTRFTSLIGRLNVGGDVNLANSALDVEVAPNSKPSGDSFIIINKTSAGAVQGNFKNLPEGANLMAKGFPFRISYAGGDGNDVVLTRLPPIIFIEQGSTNRAVTLDSVTLVRGPLPLNTEQNFSADRRTRVIFLTSSLGLNQPDPSVLTVQAAGFNLTVEGVGSIKGVTGLDGSYIVVRLPEGLPTGDLPMAITLRGMTSNTAILSISP